MELDTTTAALIYTCYLISGLKLIYNIATSQPYVTEYKKHVALQSGYCLQVQ